MDGTRYKESSKDADSVLENGLLKIIPKTPFLGKFGPKTQKCFVSNGTRYEGVFNCADFEFSHFSKLIQSNWNAPLYLFFIRSKDY